MDTDLTLRTLMAVFGLFTASWAAVQVYGWIEARRRRLHAHVEFGAFPMTPSISKTSLLAYRIETLPVLREQEPHLYMDAPGAEAADLVGRFGGYCTLQLHNTGTKTITGIRILHLPDPLEIWEQREPGAPVLITKRGPLTIDPLAPHEKTNIIVMTFSRVEEFQIWELSILHEGGKAVILVASRRTLPQYRISATWKAWAKTARLGLGLLLLWGSLAVIASILS